MPTGPHRQQLQISVLLKPQTVKYINESSALFQSVTADVSLHTLHYSIFSISQNQVFWGDITAPYNCH